MTMVNYNTFAVILYLKLSVHFFLCNFEGTQKSKKGFIKFHINESYISTLSHPSHIAKWDSSLENETGVEKK